MQVNLSIKAVPAQLAERLRQRAERNHRSLQGELMAIIEQAAADAETTEPATPKRASAVATSGLPRPAAGGAVEQGWKTIEQLVAERQARGWKADPRMAGLPLGVDIIRADRDGR